MLGIRFPPTLVHSVKWNLSMTRETDLVCKEGYENLLKNQIILLSSPIRKSAVSLPFTKAFYFLNIFVVCYEIHILETDIRFQSCSRFPLFFNPKRVLLSNVFILSHYWSEQHSMLKFGNTAYFDVITIQELSSITKFSVILVLNELKLG